MFSRVTWFLSTIVLVQYHLILNSFPHLGCVVKAALSIFTGPRVEQLFSGMNNIIDSTSNRMIVDTFSAIQTITFDLLASKQKSVSKYNRKNYLLSPIRPRLCIKMKSSFDAQQEVNDKTEA